MTYYEEPFDGFSIIEYKDFELKSPSFFVLGLPDAGLVGVIAAQHLVKALKAEEVGGIESYRYFPPLAVIHRGTPKPPIRMFVKDNLLIMVPEVAIPPAAVYPLSYMIIDYARKHGVNYLVSIVGIAVPNRMEIEKPKVYWLASTQKAEEAVKDAGIERFEEGYLVGPYAVILKESAKRRVNNIVLLVESFMEFPDPQAAAEALSVLSKIVNIEVDTKPLLEEAETIRLMARDLMKRTAKTLAQMQKGYEYQMPIMYA